MLSSIRRRRPFRGNGPWIVIAAVAVALLVTPFAVAAGEGRPRARRCPQPVVERVARVLEGDADHRQQQRLRHAPVEQVDHRRRRDLRLPREAAGTKACLRASNLSNGRAFSFATSSGTEVGRIDGPTAAAPFTTTATGVATGLNADKVDGKDAATISADANRFAAVAAGGTLGAQRGATAAANSGAGAYTVAFSDDISKCALGATVTANTVAGLATAVLAADNKTVNVVTRDARDRRRTRDERAVPPHGHLLT